MPKDDLMTHFAAIQEANRPVKLNNTYRGIPISYDATIIKINQAYVAFQVHEYQAVCMALEGKTYIQSALLPEVYQAQSVAVDVLKREVILTEFKGVGQSVGKRMSVRVHPKEPVDVEIHVREQSYPGKLADISTSGIGVFTFDTYIYGDLSFDKNTNVSIEVRLPVSDSPLNFQGKIISVVHQKDTFLHRLGVKIRSNPAAEPVLQRYLTQRHIEIMRELRVVYKSMAQNKEKVG